MKILTGVYRLEAVLEAIEGENEKIVDNFLIGKNAREFFSDSLSAIDSRRVGRAKFLHDSEVR